MKLEQYRLDRLPEIVAADDEAGGEDRHCIRIHQLTGFGGSAPGAAGGTGDGAQKPPINQVMDSILGMALQLPALRSIGDSIGLDFCPRLSAPSRHRRSTEPHADPATPNERKVTADAFPVQATRTQRSTSHASPAGPCSITAGATACWPACAPSASMPAGRADQARLASLDNSGNLDIYGKPMVMANAMAVEEINAAGGLLGRKIELKQYDSQSDIALYTKYAQQLVREDKVDVVHAGITSASREAIRQTFRRGNTLYFYNMLYEGGVCDRNCFVTGTTPAQAVEPIIDYAMKKWGNKVYVLAADYNYGQITAKWVAHYVEQRKRHGAADRLLPARRRRFRLDHRQDPGRRSPTSSLRRWSAARTCRSSASGRRRA